jgi:dipeptidyl aminopeptidase/acylaminoacyl peptidase
LSKHTKTPAACGSWPSPISATMCAVRPDGGVIMGSMFEPQTDGESLFWLSARPLEQGRVALVRWPLEGPLQECLAAPWNVRTGVCEYGGGAYVVAADGRWFSHFADGRVYRQTGNAAPEALMPAGPRRYGDFVLDGGRRRLVCVREDFSAVGRDRFEEATELVGIDLGTGAATVLVSGPDFVASPRVSSDGRELAWVSWNHPNMPWDLTSLWRGRLNAAGEVVDVRQESSTVPQARMQPRWSPDGTLYYLSDADDWWNLYRWSATETAGRKVTGLEAEVGAPAWVLGMRHFDFLDARHAVIIYTVQGYWHAATVDLQTGALLDRSARHPVLSSLTVVKGRTFVTGSDEFGNGGLYEYVGGHLDLVVPLGSANGLAGIGEISIARELIIPLPGTATTGPGEICYAWYYPPANRNHQPLPDEKPPVIVQVHGGPTAASAPAFALSRQFWTSRGFALLDVNYRGSSGRGRTFRHRLYGHYGVTDVEDAVGALRNAGMLGLVDEKRAAISGASSGGYTTLAALAWSDAFAVGINLFGVSDLEVFIESTHKFERHFLKSLVGDWAADPGLLRKRSPISRLDMIAVPLMTLQGSDDKIVPPPQSHIVMDAVRRKGLPCAYIEFPGEGHGFRRKETVERTLEASLSFYGQILGFCPADPINPVIIENFAQRPHEARP